MSRKSEPYKPNTHSQNLEPDNPQPQDLDRTGKKTAPKTARKARQMERNDNRQGLIKAQNRHREMGQSEGSEKGHEIDTKCQTE